MRGIPFLFRFFKISRSKYGWKQSSLTGKPTRFNLLFLTPPVGNLLTPLCHKKHFQLHVESVKRLIKNQLIV